MEKKAEIIDDSLKIFMNREDKYIKGILESMNYSLFSGGKRLRPIFCLKISELFNNDIQNTIPFACGIEMIHTYSLIHDDLPAMDDDDYRRGVRTNHIVYGEDMAILAGDALLNLAYEIMSKDIIDSNSEMMIRKNKALYEIGKYSGLSGMIGGQVIDVFSEEKDMDQDRLIEMYSRKTAGLFQAAAVSGAIIAGASDKEIDIIREYALYLGLSYQIQDDILDIDEDKKIDKITYLSYHNKKRAINDMNLYIDRCIELLNSLENYNTDFLKDLTLKLVNRQV